MYEVRVQYQRGRCPEVQRDDADDESAAGRCRGWRAAGWSASSRWAKSCCGSAACRSARRVRWRSRRCSSPLLRRAPEQAQRHDGRRRSPDGWLCAEASVAASPVWRSCSSALPSSAALSAAGSCIRRTSARSKLWRTRRGRRKSARRNDGRRCRIAVRGRRWQLWSASPGRKLRRASPRRSSARVWGSSSWRGWGFRWSSAPRFRRSASGWRRSLRRSSAATRWFRWASAAARWLRCASPAAGWLRISAAAAAATRWLRRSAAATRWLRRSARFRLAGQSGL